MRALLSVIGLIVGVSGAQAQTYGIYQANDTGGIIPWSCETEAIAQELAAAHCARFSKYHRITGVHRQYGDFISFQCLWDPRMAPFAMPAIRTRGCHEQPYSPRVRARH